MSLRLLLSLFQYRIVTKKTSERLADGYFSGRLNSRYRNFLLSSANCDLTHSLWSFKGRFTYDLELRAIDDAHSDDATGVSLHRLRTNAPASFVYGVVTDCRIGHVDDKTFN